MKPLIYISGPLTGSGKIRNNIQTACHIQVALIHAGFATINPHLTYFVEQNLSPQVRAPTYADWIEQDCAIISRCDGVVRFLGASPGADREAMQACKHSIPVCYVYGTTTADIENLLTDLRKKVLPADTKSRENLIDARPVNPPHTIVGIGPESPVVTNEHGGQQSALPYRFDLVDTQAMFTLAGILDYGAKRFAPNNWYQITVNEHLNHALSHIYAHLANDTQDDHLGHAFCRLMMALGVKKART